MGYSNVRGVPGWQPNAHPAAIIDGRAIARRLREEIRTEVAEFRREHGYEPGLATILVGDDPASTVYVDAKHRACEEVGIASFDHRLPADVPQDAVDLLIEELNGHKAVSGILCQLPVPKHIDQHALVSGIAATKDVDGLTQLNAGAFAIGQPGVRPCTPAGVMRLLREAEVELSGADAVVVGRSNLFGKPMAQWLVEADATVTTAHSRTKNLDVVCRRADVLIVAVGKPNLIGADWVKRGATVIDVGINRTREGLCGDVDFENVASVASAVTPVPGGVGPMTIAMLLRNTLDAALANQSGSLAGSQSHPVSDEQ